LGATNQIQSHPLCAASRNIPAHSIAFSLDFHLADHRAVPSLALSLLMAPKQTAPKQKKSGGQGSRKAVPKNPRGKTVTGPADTDDFPGETLSLAEPRSAAWSFFDNDACRRLVSLFAEVSIRDLPPKTVANILRDALPHVVRPIKFFSLLFSAYAPETFLAGVRSRRPNGLR
jgi:hypothetical protein